MFSLSGKRCVVTGASRGLGRAMALAFADQGADVVVAARSRPDLEELRAAIEAKGRRAAVAVTDVTDPVQLRACAELAVSRFGGLDVWVNNAGGDPTIDGGWREWLDVTENGWDRMLALNLKGQVFGAQAAARAMRAQGTGGSIIFLSSIDSLYAAPGGEGIYGACKAAINNITQTVEPSSWDSSASASTRSRRPSSRRRSRPLGWPRPRTGESARRSIRCAGSASPQTWPRLPCTSPPMRRHGSPAPSCWCPAAPS